MRKKIILFLLAGLVVVLVLAGIGYWIVSVKENVSPSKDKQSLRGDASLESSQPHLSEVRIPGTYLSWRTPERLVWGADSLGAGNEVIGIFKNGSLCQQGHCPLVSISWMPTDEWIRNYEGGEEATKGDFVALLDSIYHKKQITEAEKKQLVGYYSGVRLKTYFLPRSQEALETVKFVSNAAGNIRGIAYFADLGSGDAIAPYYVNVLLSKEDNWDRIIVVRFGLDPDLFGLSKTNSSEFWRLVQNSFSKASFRDCIAEVDRVVASLSPTQG